MKPICPYCSRTPDQIGEYIEAVAYLALTPDEYVLREEFTYNPDNGHFACSECYIKIGVPFSPHGWVCP